MSLVIPLFALPILLTTSCSVVKNEKKPLIIDENLNNLKSSDIFPNLYIEDYYSFVEFDNNAEPIITHKLLMKVVKDVVNRISTNKGEINFSISTYSKNSVDVHFKWNYLDIVLYKTYSIEIKK